MMRSIRRTLLTVLALALLTGAATPGACAEFYGIADSLQKVDIHENSYMTVLVGKTITFNLFGFEYPEKPAGFQTVYSTRPWVASVTEEGLVTALSIGTTDIVWELAGDYYGMAACRLTLNVVNSYEPSGIRFNKKSATVYAGMHVDLRPMLRTDPAGTAVDTGKLKWSTSDKKIVSVNKKGKIVAQKPGTATIRATYGTQSASITVKVGRNKVDNLTAKPSPSKLKANSYDVLLKSVEIVSPKKAIAEYYFVANYPSNRTSVSLTEFQTDVWANSSETLDSYYETTIAGNRIDVKLNLRGRGVKLFKVVYTGLDSSNYNLKACRKWVTADWQADLNTRVTKSTGSKKKTVTQKIHKQRIRLN